MKVTKEELKKSPNESIVEASFKEVFPLKEPYAYGAIARDSETKGLKYIVIEPTLTEEEKKQMKKIIEILRETLDVDLKRITNKEKAEEYLRKAIKEVVEKYKIKVEGLSKIEYYIIRDFIYYGKIDPLMHDHMIEDISCDGYGIPIYVWHREYESIPTNIVFEEKELDSFIIRLAYLAGKHISIANPILDASLPDGSRIQLTLGKEVTKRGSTFTIRRFRADPLTITDLISFNTLTSDMAAWFWFVIEKKANLMIAGGTASGKTTTLNSLSAFIPPDNKIITIEDTPELNLPHQNWIPSIARVGFGPSGSAAEITLFDLLKAAMRQRPDYIIVGEVRGAEAFTLFQAMATGHGGLSSIHADSAVAVINRLESEPMNIPRSLILTLNVIAMQSRVRVANKTARRVSHIVELIGMDPVSKEIIMNDVYKWDPKTDRFLYSGRSILIERLMEKYGITEDKVKLELERRRTVLEWMVKLGIRRYDAVGKVIREYYMDPERVYEKAKLGLSA
ncbi:MAG: type II/IV secretion system ATPase subunit [Candidatus Bathyarchaeia archaeon]|nr:type II/IV secretion system ATPase subunit [Candidatus Bathyarchaeota archaeon]